MDEKVRKLDVFVDEENMLEGVQKVIEGIRKDWDVEKVSYKTLTDGITNKLVKCSLVGLPDEEAVLVRIYGNKTDLLIDRSMETKNILMLNKVNLAPQLFATFNNGLAYAFVPGCTLDHISVKEPKIYKLVARQLAKLHRVKVPGSAEPSPVLWKKLQSFLNLVPERFGKQETQKRYEQEIIPKQRIQEELNDLKNKLSDIQSPVVFCHNDILLGNIIYTEPKNCVTFIDYEYATLNYQAFDIGNHFAEFSGVESLDFSRYPNKSLQLDWLSEYLTAYQGGFTDDELEMLYVQVNHFALAAHLFWGIWALIQAEYSYIDFDFVKYAGQKLNEYLTRKQEFLSLQLPR